ncbi:MAG TPA: hypothetical protein VJO99_11265 [Burkholderiaceae bacterium]|nr:hypothetical protein [Burkholderiaceae bacterium]
MVNGTVPIKTPDGQAELSTRARRLSQRHRTVLFLVDGKRSAVEVRTLASKAGVPDSCFDELLELGLIMLPPPTFSLLIEDEPGAADTLHVDLPLSGPNGVSAFRGADDDSVLPPSRTLQPETTQAGQLLDDESPADSWYAALNDAPNDDTAFVEARNILVRAVRQEAPVAGSLTLMRLRRARSRADLVALLDEVEARITKPHRSLAAAQTLRRVRHLLGSRVASA